MANTDRGPRGKFIKTDEVAHKSAEAARLRSRGQSYQQIADALGYADPTGARRAVERALVAIVAEPAAEVRQFQLMQLDELAHAALAVLDRLHLTVSHGRVMRDDNDETIPDDGPRLAAIDRLLRIQERRAKLLGLDAPSRVEVLTDDLIDAELARLEAAESEAAADSEAEEAEGEAGRREGT